MKIVLASASPRRRELLLNIGIRDFDVVPARGEERVDPNLSPQELVCALSRDKALEVAAAFDADTLVIAADTIVALDGAVLGKPRDAEDAKRMLQAMSGRAHTVFTGVTVLRGDVALSEFERTEVRFKPLSRREIDAYIATGEPMDKAGAYGAQGMGSLFVEGITGDFFNVMGLPVFRLSEMLEKLGVRLL